MVNYKGSCTWHNKLPLTNNWFVSCFPNTFIRKASLWLWNFTVIFKVILPSKTKASKKDSSTLKTKAELFRHLSKDTNKHLRNWTELVHTNVFQGKWHLSEAQCVCRALQYQTSTSSEILRYPYVLLFLTHTITASRLFCNMALKFSTLSRLLQAMKCNKPFPVYT